jgi:hypothetical protein
VAVGQDEFLAISWTSATRDNGYWSPDHPTRLTAPTDGDYMIGGTVRWHPHHNDAKGVRNIGLAVNGPDPASPTQTHIADVEWVTTEYAGAYGLQSVSTYYPLRAGDYVELIAYQWNEEGEVVSIEPSGGVSPALWMVRLGCS